MPGVASGRPGAVPRARQAADNLVRKLQRRARLLELNLEVLAEAVEELTGPMGPELRKRVVAVIPHLARQLAGDPGGSGDVRIQRNVALHVLRCPEPGEDLDIGYNLKELQLTCTRE